MVKGIEKYGIPVVHIATVVPISKMIDILIYKEEILGINFLFTNKKESDTIKFDITKRGK